MASQTATDSPDYQARKAEFLTMSGLEFMEKVLKGEIPGPPIAEGFNVRLTDVARGQATFTGAPQAAHCNMMFTVHGGWYGTVLDSAMGCAVMTVVPKGSVYTTLEYKINITRPIPIGMTVLATSSVQHAGRRTAVANGEIRGAEDGKLYATGSTTCIIMAQS